MSDRRPENPTLWMWGCGMTAPEFSANHTHEMECLVSADLLAVVRRGVESGEIEGLPLFCAAHWCALTPDESTCSLYQRVEGMDTCSIEYRILLIPTTDSERHP